MGATERYLAADDQRHAPHLVASAAAHAAHGARGPGADREDTVMDRLLTAEEVAQRLGVRTQWVWAQARAQRIPHVRVGRYRRFRESAVEAWVCELSARAPRRRERRCCALRPAADALASRALAPASSTRRRSRQRQRQGRRARARRRSGNSPKKFVPQLFPRPPSSRALLSRKSVDLQLL